MDNNLNYLKELIINEYYDKIGGAISPDEFLALALHIAECNSDLIGIDYEDISMTLCDADRVDAQSSVTNPQNIAETARDIHNSLLSFHRGESLAKMLIHIDINQFGDVKMDDVSALSKFLGELPDTVDVIWGISTDEKLPENEVRVNVIVNFKM